MSGNSLRGVARCSTWLAVGMLVLQPQFLLAANSAATGPFAPAQVVDVALQAGGTLQGRIVGSQGQTLASQRVSVLQGQSTSDVITDDQGNFAVTGLTGGSYQVRVGNHCQLIRAWAPGTAPPLAVDRLMVVPQDAVVLGQDCGGSVCGSGVGCKPNCLRHPLILGTIIAAAIAIPIAVDSNDDPSST